MSPSPLILCRPITPKSVAKGNVVEVLPSHTDMENEGQSSLSLNAFPAPSRAMVGWVGVLTPSEGKLRGIPKARRVI